MLDLRNIDAFIFDLGGVIIDLDFDRSITAFSQLCGFDARQFYTDLAVDSLFEAFEMGLVTVAAFRDGIRDRLGISCSDKDLDDAWNALMVGLPPQRLELLQTLRQDKSVLLLSNNNEINKGCCDVLLKSTAQNPDADWKDWFDVTYFSHEVGDRKPNVTVFERILEEQGLEPSRTLFLEDTPKNLVGAQQAGLQVLHVTPGMEICDLNWQLETPTVKLAEARSLLLR